MPLLYDQLLVNPYIEKETKQHLTECVVVEATNVSDYYFEGTDQEYWDLAKDFPNVAPPFETFFLEFRAPEQIVSSKTGTTPWPKSQPCKWGILCLSAEYDDLMPNLDTEEGRADFLKHNEAQIEGLHKILRAEDVQQLNALCVMHDRAGTKDFIAQSPKDRQRSIQLYVMAFSIRMAVLRGEWDEVKEYLSSHRSPARWRLAGMLFAQFRDSRLQHQFGPYIGWEMQVGPEGQLLTKSDGDVDILYSAYGSIERKANQMLEVDHETGLAFFKETVVEGFSNQLRTMLLAISFMHCKNVTLTEVKPCRPKPLNNRQRRRGESPRQHVTYHILDIEPMKQVLKTEGQSEKTGIQRSLHICRGHFAHYSEDKKLFGKYAGTFWKPQHVRGSLDVGIAAKDYRIKEVRQAL